MQALPSVAQSLHPPPGKELVRLVAGPTACVGPGVPRFELPYGCEQSPVFVVPKWMRLRQLATYRVPAKPVGNKFEGTASAAWAAVSCFEGKFGPFQKLLKLLAVLSGVPGSTARCNTVIDEVSMTRSPPVSPSRSTSIAELVAQFMKLPLNAVPPQVRLMAARSR